MSATSDYEADVHRRGWVFLLQLPANTPLGASVAGAPGARSPWSPNGSSYELAPLPVRIEQGFQQLVFEQNKKMANDVVGIGDALSKAAEATGLDHGIGGLVAKTLGIPPWVLLILVVFVGYAVLRQYGLVPPLKKVIK